MKLNIDPRTLSLLNKLGSFLTEQATKSYIVGGFVRDILLERASADIDIAVSGDALVTALKIASAFGGKYIPLDESNGIGRVVLPQTDEDTSQDKWTLDLTTFGNSIEENLSGRDFTIDAIAVDLDELIRNPNDITLIDPTDGRDDLDMEIIRMVSPDIFNADAARLLRAIRLTAELNFKIDEKTEALIRHQCLLVQEVSGERIREELLRLFSVPQTEELIYHFDDLGLLGAIIPELVLAKGVDQPNEHFWNVFDHSMKTVVAVEFLLRHGDWKYYSADIRNSVPWSEELADYFASDISRGSSRMALIRIAALLHDVAKPQTKAVNDKGRMRFLGHAEDGAVITATILKRLKFSNKETRLVETMVRYHLRPGQISREEEMPSHRAIYRYFRDTGEAAINTLFLSLADHLAARGPQLKPNHWKRHSQIVNYMLTKRFEETIITPPKLVDGNDLINILGMSPGPSIGEYLEQIREAQVTGELTSREEALSYVKKHIQQGSVQQIC
ncbi:CCA tRNA nucleotidyltransferase [Chloroflexota bacterium]